MASRRRGAGFGALVVLTSGAFAQGRLGLPLPSPAPLADPLELPEPPWQVGRDQGEEARRQLQRLLDEPLGERPAADDRTAIALERLGAYRERIERLSKGVAHAARTGRLAPGLLAHLEALVAEVTLVAAPPRALGWDEPEWVQFGRGGRWQVLIHRWLDDVADFLGRGAGLRELPLLRPDLLAEWRDPPPRPTREPLRATMLVVRILEATGVPQRWPLPAWEKLFPGVDRAVLLAPPWGVGEEPRRARRDDELLEDALSGLGKAARAGELPKDLGPLVDEALRRGQAEGGVDLREAVDLARLQAAYEAGDREGVARARGAAFAERREVMDGADTAVARLHEGLLEAPEGVASLQEVGIYEAALSRVARGSALQGLPDQEVPLGLGPEVRPKAEAEVVPAPLASPSPSPSPVATPSPSPARAPEPPKPSRPPEAVPVGTPRSDPSPSPSVVPVSIPEPEGAPAPSPSPTPPAEPVVPTAPSSGGSGGWPWLVAVMALAGGGAWWGRRRVAAAGAGADRARAVAAAGPGGALSGSGAATVVSGARRAAASGAATRSEPRHAATQLDPSLADAGALPEGGELPGWLRFSLEAALGSRYQDYELLGSGGMGCVVRARDTRLGRTVAVKVPPPHLATDTHFRSRFLREAQALARLQHPNVAIVHDIPEVGRGDVPVMILEYLQGTDLAEVLGRQGPRPWAEVREWILQAADGLAHAHDQGILHRDLKPANLMRLEGSGRIKVLDFGLAAVADTGGLTRSGMLMGSLPYMPPEQLRGERVDARADVYALGVTAYELVSGRLPFDPEDSQRVRAAAIRSLAPGVPAALDDLFTQVLDPDPGRRPGSMGEFRDLVAGVGANPGS